MELISKRIRRLRFERDEMTQADLSAASRVPQGMITSYETGRKIPTRDTCRKLAKGFKLTLREFEDRADFTKPATAKKKHDRSYSTDANIPAAVYPAGSHFDHTGAPLEDTSPIVAAPVSPDPATRARLEVLAADARRVLHAITELLRLHSAADVPPVHADGRRSGRPVASDAADRRARRSAASQKA